MIWYVQFLNEKDFEILFNFITLPTGRSYFSLSRQGPIIGRNLFLSK